MEKGSWSNNAGPAHPTHWGLFRLRRALGLVTKAPAAWSVEMVAGAFKGANKGDVEEVLDSLAALGILAGYEAGGARRWKLTRATA